jgi:hypothetical protein
MHVEAVEESKVAEERLDAAIQVLNRALIDP